MLLIVAGVLLAAVRPGPLRAAVAGSPQPVVQILAGDGPVTVRQAATGSPDRSADRPLVSAVLSDLQTYWAATLPGLGKPFTPLAGGYLAVDSSAAEIPGGAALCISTPAQIAGNAYFCPAEDGIVYDSSTLVPVLLGSYGAGGLMAAFAHEFGHAVQHRIGPTEADRAATPDRYPNLLIEAQGDCYAGNFLAWVRDGKAPHLRLPPGALLRAAGPLLDFRDAETVTAGDGAAHGLGMDRLRALLTGLAGDPARCHRLDLAALAPVQGRPGTVPPSATPRFPTTEAALAAAGPTIGAVAEQVFPGRSPGLAGVAPDPADLTVAGGYGQFAAATALALAAGKKLTGSDTGAACFAGAWVKSVYGKASGVSLGSWVGDPDEAMDLVRARPGATFDQLAAFAAGFDRGVGGCG